MVPALVHAIKVAGLVLVADASNINQAPKDQNISDVVMDTSSGASGESGDILLRVDGVLQGNGVLQFNETFEMP